MTPVELAALRKALSPVEVVRAVLDGITFAEPFVPVAAAHLRPGGAFT